MNTYLFKDSTHYKIGKSLDVYRRYMDMYPHNPTIEIVTFIDKNIEGKLLKKYKNNRVKREWFVFTDLEVKNIIKNDFGNPNINEIIYKDYLIEDGKYKGRYLVTLTSIEEINWLKTYDNEAFKYWSKYSLRYSFMFKNLKEFNLKKENFDYRERADLVTNLKDILTNLNILSIDAYSKTENITYNGAKKRIKSGFVDTVNISGKTFIIY